MELFPYIFAVVVFLSLILFSSALRIAPEWQRLVVFRLGRFLKVSGPGLVIVLPGIDRVIPVDIRSQKVSLSEQNFTSRDRINVPAGAACEYRIESPADSVLNVPDCRRALEDGLRQALAQEIERLVAREIVNEPLALQQSVLTHLEGQSRHWGVKPLQVTVRVGKTDVPPEPAMTAPARNTGRLQTPSPLVGTAGETVSTIYMEGTVAIGGQLWAAVSKRPIPPGKQVRVARLVLEVEECE